MSNCIKDLYDYDLVKKCCRCKSICLKSNFHKSKKISVMVYLLNVYPVRKNIIMKIERKQQNII